MALSRWMARRENGSYAVTARRLTTKEKKQAIREMAGSLNKSLRSLEEKGLSNASPFYRKFRGLIEDESPLIGRSVKGDYIFKQGISGLTEDELNQRFNELRQYAGMKTRHFSNLADIYPDFVTRHRSSKGKVTYTVNNERIEFYRQAVESHMFRIFADIYGSDTAFEFYEDSSRKGNSTAETDSILNGIDPWTGEDKGVSVAEYSRENHPALEMWQIRLDEWRPPTIDEATEAEQRAFSNDLDEFV